LLTSNTIEDGGDLHS